jgi:hypothetical protein
MSLFVPAEIGKMTDITSQTVSLKDEHVAWNQSSSGVVNVSWNTQEETMLSNDFMTVSVKLNKNVENAEILSLFDGGLRPEMYSSEGNTVKAQAFRFSSLHLEDKFELFQNVPNPFTGKTTISFNLPIESQVKISIYDVTGKVIYKHEDYYGKGRHNADIDIQSIDVQGLLYYRVDTQYDSAVKRMIAIK